MSAHYIKDNVRKRRLAGVRLQEIDFEYLRKMSEKHNITISEQLRKIIKNSRKMEKYGK